MKKYMVIFKKYVAYEVEANSLSEAEDKGYDILDHDMTSFMLDPVDEVEVQEIP